MKEHILEADARIQAQLRRPVSVVVLIVGSLVLGYWAPFTSWGAEMPRAITYTIGVGFAVFHVAAFLAFRIGGPHSRLYETALIVEAGFFCTSFVIHILVSSTPYNVGWLMHILFVLQSSQSPLRRRGYEALVVGVPVAAVAGHLVMANWSLAFADVVFSAFILFMRSTVQRAAMQTAEQHGRTLALEKQLRALELKAERARIARDLHDGVSSELHALIWVLGQKRGEGDELAARLRSAADEVRDVVWGLSVVDRPWDEWLADLRARCRELCGDTLVLQFSCSATATPQVSARTQHALTRILLEATRNAVRHSGGNTLRIQLAVDGGEVRVDIEDDGRGFTERLALSSPRGLSNLRHRAAELGGRCIIDDTGCGASVRVAIPVAQ